MTDAASFDAILQCNLLEVFCEALDAAVIVTDRLDELSFASIRLIHHFPVSENAIAPGTRARDLYGALFDAGCRFGALGGQKDKNREDWIAERVASAWRERVDTIEQSGPDRWFRIVSRRFSSGLGLMVIQDVTEHRKKENQWRIEHERVRMTEEILDTLPVAVAIKDHNLNYAAVNQQFCNMLSITPETVLGRGVWDVFEPELAAAIEEKDWHLLATGVDRTAVIQIDRPGGESVRFLHRAKRIGKAGSHYLCQSFDELPVDSTGTLSRFDPVVRLKTGSAEIAAVRDLSSRIEGAITEPKTRKVAYVNTAAGSDDIIVDARRFGVDLCVIRTMREFADFLPVVEGLGIKLDLVVIEPNADFAFLTMAARHGIRHRMLPPGADVLERIVDALEHRTRRTGPSKMPVQPAESAPDGKSTDIDILAVEDNPVNRMVIEQILESLGLNFVVVTTGRDAIEKIAELNPKIVFVDVTLPDMDIGEFMASLEPLLSENGITLPIIGMISGDDLCQRQICSQAGLSDTLAKPLSPEAVDIALRKHLLHEPVQSPSSAKSAA